MEKLDAADGEFKRVAGAGATPVFSPDGRRIAYTASVSNDPVSAGLYIMNADGTQKTLLTSAFGYSGGSPGWSPDGHQIVFKTDNGIYVIKVDGIPGCANYSA